MYNTATRVAPCFCLLQEFTATMMVASNAFPDNTAFANFIREAYNVTLSTAVDAEGNVSGDQSATQHGGYLQAIHVHVCCCPHL